MWKPRRSVARRFHPRGRKTSRIPGDHGLPVPSGVTPGRKARHVTGPGSGKAARPPDSPDTAADRKVWRGVSGVRRGRKVESCWPPVRRCSQEPLRSRPEDFDSQGLKAIPEGESVVRSARPGRRLVRLPRGGRESRRRSVPRERVRSQRKVILPRKVQMVRVRSEGSAARSCYRPWRPKGRKVAGQGLMQCEAARSGAADETLSVSQGTMKSPGDSFRIARSWSRARRITRFVVVACRRKTGPRWARPGNRRLRAFTAFRKEAVSRLLCRSRRGRSSTLTRSRGRGHLTLKARCGVSQSNQDFGVAVGRSALGAT
jgi:hypothetical protein